MKALERTLKAWALAKRQEMDPRTIGLIAAATQSLYCGPGSEDVEGGWPGFDKAAQAFFEYVQLISPRDWGSGVPAHWVYDDLTYADAVRPKNEKLSVVPPLAYGCTHHIV